MTLYIKDAHMRQLCEIACQPCGIQIELHRIVNEKVFRKIIKRAIEIEPCSTIFYECGWISTNHKEWIKKAAAIVTVLESR